MNMQLHIALEESKIRHENRMAAIKFGLFGQHRDEIIKNLKNHTVDRQAVVDEACEKLIESFQQI